MTSPTSRSAPVSRSPRSAPCPAPFGYHYSAITFGQDTSLHATAGYDDVTGVGTPAPAYLNSYRLP